ncbi:MAG: hypothetical protein MSA74_00795, partial [Ruminococcus sp.]|nr:hypothetical protein [Ruminococcus sp.]
MMIAYGSLFVLILLSFSLRLQHPRQKLCFPSKNPCLRIDRISLHIEYRATSSFVRYSNSTIDKKREIMYNNSQKELKNMIPVEIRKLIIKNREEGVKVSEI